ncbi:MAG: putative peptidase rane zinc metallopeptidase [Anaerocolumna sp.]|jgi:Zn-dependent membrane protease YugP|nr:putative peptidase rane zinc metallopeptidase [Anaerocolumna sp.]
MFYGYGFGYLDPTYVLVIIGVVLSLAASASVKMTFSKYSKVRSLSGMTGAEAAERILHSAGIYDVSVQQIAGDLTDHYDPRSKILRLSETVYGRTSVAAIGVAAHECGHAIQHNHGYVPLKLRSAIVPVASFGSNIAWPVIILGIIMGNSMTLINLGIILFSFAVIFQLVTLPVEFNASSRAIRVLDESGILYSEEISHTKKVLGAAALTYVAAAAASILQLLRLVILFGGRNRD